MNYTDCISGADDFYMIRTSHHAEFDAENLHIESIKSKCTLRVKFGSYQHHIFYDLDFLVTSVVG